ncbi:MAG: alginate export family protein [Planctomycetaceae bacterium]
MSRLRWRLCWFSVLALPGVLWCEPHAGRAAEAPVVSVPAADTAAADGSEPKLAPAEEAPLSVAFREHLAAPQSGPCGRPDCPICNPKPAAKPPAPILPWKPLYFDNDFSYKTKPNAPHFLGEELKNIPLFDGDCEPSGLTLSYGGEIRHRYMNEDNRLRPGGPGRSDYDLYRWRQYLDLKYRDEFRVYIEGIDASIFNNELPVTGIDKNRWDIQNVFFDLKVAERDGKPVYFRAGRQELLYGTPSAVSPGQQVISPLDWANTRRNFEGFKLFSKGETWDLDLFAVQPVNTANPTGRFGGRPAATTTVLGVVDPAAVNKWDNQFDHADSSRWYGGAYLVYKGIKDNTIEPYYVWLQTDSGQQVGTWADGNRHTLGLRWTMTKPIKDECDQPWVVFASDIEGAYQFGKDNNENVQAGFFTSKLGTTFSQVAWTPQLSFLYYYGSGDTKRGDGTNSTYDVLVPLNHAYWGIIDNLSGQNLNDYAVQATIKPHAKLTGLAAFHWFNQVTASDNVYNVAGTPVGGLNTGTNLGQELDLISTYSYNPNFDVQFGYSWFWYGSHFRGANGTLNGRPIEDATQLYIQTSLRY